MTPAPIPARTIGAPRAGRMRALFRPALVLLAALAARGQNVDPNTPVGTAPYVTDGTLPATGWTLTFSDEFAGAAGSAVNPRWNTDISIDRGIQTNGGLTPYHWFMESSLVSIDGNGHAQAEIEDTGTKDSSGDEIFYAGRLDTTVAGWTGGGSHDQTTFAQAYGYWEARIQIQGATEQGHQASWWLFPPNGTSTDLSDATGAAGAEYDIMESNQMVEGYSTAVHFDGYASAEETSQVYIGAPNGNLPLPKGDLPHDGFHIYGFAWTPQQVSFYFDGVLYRTLGTEWVSNVPEFPIIGGGIASNAWDVGNVFDSITPGNPDYVYFDYVRVWTTAIPYAWAGGNTGAAWSTATDWSPTNGPPGVLDLASNGSATGSSAAANGTGIGTIDSGAATWTIFNPGSQSATFTAGVINQGSTYGSGNLMFRDNPGGSGGLVLVAGTINVNSGTLYLGASGASAGQELAQLGPVSALTLSGTGAGTQLNLNVLSDYSLGVVDAAGTTSSTIILIANSDTALGAYSRNVTVTGLEGTGPLTIDGTTGPSNLVGGYATLNLLNSGATNYSSSTVLSDGVSPAAGAVHQLALAVNLTGTGTQTLTGASTYSGGTAIDSGTLYVSNATGSGLGTGPVTVAAGGTLGGTGFIAPGANNVTVAGTLSPGDLVNPAGTLTFDLSPGNQLVFAAGAQLNLTLGTSSSALAFGGSAANVVSGLGNLTLNLTEGAGFQTGQSYVLFGHASAAAAGTVASLAGITLDGGPMPPSQYRVVVDSSGDYTLAPVAPAISSPPASVTLAAGQTASFFVAATGTQPFTYQWKLNGTAIANAADTYLVVANVSSATAGSYTCDVTNSAGTTLSPAATLTLGNSTDLGRLTNVSVRTDCGTGSANIIAGFVIGGSGTNSSTKELLIRADGPELGSEFSVPGFLPDPSLDVFNTAGSSPVSVGQNTGWCVTQTNQNEVVAAAGAVYAFPLTTNSASSAVVLTLPSDSYTENVAGAVGDIGIALAEIYDVSNATETYSPAIPRLINVSARANVAAGAGNLIAGFTIGGSTDKTVLVRGTGPGLAEFGLAGLLDAPTLAVYSTTGADALMGTNTGWGEDTVLASVAASVYAFTQTSSADCALLVTLPPGTYTANLNSNDGTSGLALVEVYEVP